MEFISLEHWKSLDLAADEYQIIDIRTPEEVAEAAIEGSVNLDVMELAQTEHTEWQDKVLLFHCRTHGRTLQAAPILAKIPCRESYILEGGIEAWKQAGEPVIAS